MRYKKTRFIPYLFTLAVVFVLYSVNFVEGAENQLANKRYVDPKGYFQIVPPAGWQVQEFPQDPRGKVRFLASDASLSIIVQADNVSTFHELVKLSRQLESRIGISTNIKKTQFGGRQVVKRSFEVKGKKVFAISFLVGSMTHNLQLWASPDAYKNYVSVVTKSMETYEPVVRSTSEKDIIAQQTAKKLRMAHLMIDEGNYDLALEFIKEGLEWSPQHAELLNLKKEVESRKAKR